MKFPPQNVLDCIDDLNTWLMGRPYFDYMLKLITEHGKTKTPTGMLFISEKNYSSEVHLYPHFLKAATKTNSKQEYLIFEYIAPILLKHKIETISIGCDEYKLKKGIYKKVKTNC